MPANEFTAPMPEEYVPVMVDYEKEANAFVERILNDERLGKPDSDASPFDTRMSVLNSMLSRMVALGAVKMFERVEELCPMLQSREQLAMAFATEFSDIQIRTGCIARHYADTGNVLSVVDDQKNLASVH